MWLAHSLLLFYCQRNAFTHTEEEKEGKYSHPLWWQWHLLASVALHNCLCSSLSALKLADLFPTCPAKYRKRKGEGRLTTLTGLVNKPTVSITHYCLTLSTMKLATFASSRSLGRLMSICLFNQNAGMAQNLGFSHHSNIGSWTRSTMIQW